jgi:hypothetical protein
MDRVLQRLLDPAYLYALQPGPLGRWGIVYVAWAALLAAGLGAALWWRSRARHRAASITAGACGAGLVLLGLRFLSPVLSSLPAAQLAPEARYVLLDVWTARVWPLSATLLALLAPLAQGLSHLRLPALLQRHVDACVGALGQEDAPLSLPQNALLGSVHLAGLAWLWYAAGRPPWWAIPSLALLSALPALARPRRVRLETLAPLLPAYLLSLVSFFVSGRLHVDLADYQAFAFPDPWSPWFDVSVPVATGVTYTLLIQARMLSRARSWPLRWQPAIRERALPLSLGVLVLLWLGSVVVVHRTHGVTASDPYCYVQMAIDLARTGSPLHDFPLAGLARDLDLPAWPTVHVGYHPPFFENRSPTMWSIGWPALMVPFYWLGGLEALYWVAPLAGALSLLATWLLVNEVLRGQPVALRWTVAALTCLLVATSPEGSERVLVPMADAAAQLFTTLTLWLLLRGRRERSLAYGLLAGASFGMAYFIRHPQLPLGVAAVAAAWTARASIRRRLGSLLAFGSAALVVVLPDLVYHRAVFGGWLNSESSEWFLLSASNIGRSFFAVLQQGVLRRWELGFLAPFALYGAWLLWRRHRRPALVLGAGLAAVLLFHLCYAALRPRDLIAIWPVLYLCAAYGFAAAWQLGQERRTPAAALWLTCCMTLLFARSVHTLEMPWREDVITFGHVRADQLRAFKALHTLSPENAVIGSMLNGGAIELYAGRAAIHPAPWTEDELQRWTDALLSQGRPFYVLDDGEEMPPVLAHLRQAYQVQAVQRLNLPYFALGGGNIPRPVWLYQVKPMR